jgi:D-alanyl-D-alanine carboxypeptidase/D-alanyl-D-alanine-endopeptidase (penicillin-binding protein 4)
MLSNRLFPACPRAFMLASLLTLGAAASPAQSLPAEVTAALAKARVPSDALTVLVTDVDGRIPPRLAHRAGAAVNPASIMKLVTTYAAIEHLGVGWTWRTPVYLDGPIQGDVLQGNVYIRGQGDPKLVVERLWLLLRRLQGLGIRSIQGDIVLDHSAFEAVATDPAAFDGEPLRPYNAAPDALLLNYKSFALTLVPDARNGVAQVHLEPPLWGVRVPRSVPLAAAAECGDWRTALKADFSDPSQIRLGGVFAAGCGEKVWPVAYADPASFAARAVEGLWRQTGGQLTGRVRDGNVPAALVPTFELVSPALPEVIRDINKYSNNVMAQQLFLTLSLNARGNGTLAGSRELVRTWWKERFGDAETPVLDTRCRAEPDGTHQRPGAGPVVAGGLGLAPDARTGVFPARHRRGRHLAAQQGPRRGSRSPEDRQSARRHRRCRLCARRQRAALRAGGHREPPWCCGGAAGH